MKELFMDLETYSSRDLALTGVYPYAEDPEFRILLISYSADGGPVRLVDVECGEEIPEEFTEALTDPSVLKWAYNANFERVCLSRLCRDRGILKEGEFLNPESWRCSMVLAAVNGLPLSLADAGAALGLEKQKMTEGRELIRLFCRPRPGWDSRAGERILPRDRPEKWEMFRKYNIRDVETELGIHEALAAGWTHRGTGPLTQESDCMNQLWKEYALDQRINDRGVLIDRLLAVQAWLFGNDLKEDLVEKIFKRTGLRNPGSVTQLQGWLSDRGIRTASLDKDAVSRLLQDSALAPEIREVLEMRKRLARTSVNKYQAMVVAMCDDNRVRGTFQFYGASRTGRFSGRLIQLQNLPQNHMEDLEAARILVKWGWRKSLEKTFGDPTEVLSQLIRTALIPSEGKKFIVCDYSAIEARILSWLAGEKWRMEVFEQGGDIYSASASAMFHVPVEKHGANSDLRQKGKIAELALGYGGAAGALKAMGALEMGLTEEELPGLVQRWRNSNPRIVRFWRAVDQAVTRAVRDGEEICFSDVPLRFRCEHGKLIITLPSGRELVYRDVQIREGRFGRPCVSYMGTNAAKKWERIESYGPKFVENIVQGIARDILCHAMVELQDTDIVAHVHDEIILEAPPEMTVAEVEERMEQTPPWAPGLVLRAEGYECWNYYRKE